MDFFKKITEEHLQEWFGLDYTIGLIGVNDYYSYTHTVCGDSDYHSIFTFNNTCTDHEIDYKWIKFMYLIFGEEYKEWYLKEQNKIFE